MPWPFDREYMQLALAAGLIIGACAPLIGAFLVERQLSLLGDGIGHLAFAGVAAGLLLSLWPTWTALAAAVLGAVAVDRLRIRRRAAGDLALALLFYGGIATGVVLTGLGPGLNANIFAYLFGSILTVGPGDLWIVALLGAVIIGAMALTGRALFAILIDEQAARAGGLPVDALNLLLAVLAAVTVVAAMRVVGVLLVAALMVLPVGASRALARSFRQVLAIAVAVGVGSVVVGLVAARLLGLAAGGAIVLVAALAFGISSLLAGAVRRAGRRRRRGGAAPPPVAKDGDQVARSARR